MRYFLLSLFISISFSCLAQSDATDRAAEPSCGLQNLAQHFFEMELDSNHQNYLAGKNIELVFRVDGFGRTKLEEINAETDAAINDLLLKRSQTVCRFRPAVKNGETVPSLYFLQLPFPTSFTENNSPINFYYLVDNAGADDYQLIEEDNQQVDVVFGVASNILTGEYANYLDPGIGMYTCVNFSGKRNWGGGLTMTFFSNSRTQDFDIQSTTTQLNNPPTIFIGLNAHRWVELGLVKKRVLMQFEFCYAVQNITRRSTSTNENLIQFRGFSPGLTFHLPVYLGQSRPAFSYGSLYSPKHFLSIHAGYRPLFFGNSSVGGGQVELGLAYRLTGRSIRNAIFTEEYLEAI